MAKSKSPKRAKKVASSFYSSALPQVGGASFNFTKVLWILVYLFGLFIFVLQMKPLVKKYIRHDVVVDIDVKDREMVNWPLISICDTSPLKKRNLKNNSQLADIDEAQFQNILKGFTDPKCNKFEWLCNDGKTCISKYNLCNYVSECPDNSDEELCLYNKYLALFDTHDKINPYNIILFKEEEIVRYGTEHTTFITNFFINDFDYTGIWINPTMPLVVSVPTFKGMCFQFDISRVGELYRYKDTQRLAIGAGSKYSIRFAIFLDVDENVGLFTPTSSADLSVHALDFIPVLRRNPIPIYPGSRTRISLNEKKIVYPKHPYSDCMSNYPEDVLLPSMFRNSKYSYEYCKELCFQKYLITMADCTDDFMLSKAFNIKFCDMWNITQRFARQNSYMSYREVQENLVNRKLNCPCRKQCVEEEYDWKSDYMSWPTEEYIPYLLERLAYRLKTLRFSMHNAEFPIERFINKLYEIIKNGNTTSENLSLAKSMIKRNMAEVEVFFEDLAIKEVTINPDYDFYQLIADSGGNLGLWTGWSFLIAVECIHTMLELAAVSVIKLMRKNSRSSNTEMENC